MVNAISSPTTPPAAAGNAVASLLSLNSAAADPAPEGTATGKPAETFDFASVLGLATLPASPDAPMPAAEPAAAILPATGKPTGKELPPVLPELADTAKPAPQPAEDVPSEKPQRPAIDILPTLLVWTPPIVISPALPEPAASPVTSAARPGPATVAPPLATLVTSVAQKATTLPAATAAPAAGQAKPAAVIDAAKPAAVAGETALAPTTSEAPADAPRTVTTVALPRVAITLPEPAAPPIAAVLAARAPVAAAPQSTASVEAAPVETSAPVSAAPAQVAAAPGRQPSADPGRQDAPGRESNPSAPEPLAATRAIQPVFAADIAALAPAPTNAAPAQDRPVIAPATTAANAPQDLAGLVERLVAARDAAAPQSVDASVAHGEFGRVGLRFVQDSGALVVSMTSADPGFAPAVQAAAAASVPSGLMQDPAAGSQRDARGDGNAQNQSATPQQGQSASAGSGQSQAARRNETLSSAPARARGDDGDPPPAGARADGGIYA